MRWDDERCVANFLAETGAAATPPPPQVTSRVVRTSMRLRRRNAEVVDVIWLYSHSRICKDVQFWVLVTIINCERVVFAEDMARFVDNYPEYKKMQGNVSKHVTLVTEMSKIVESRKLMTVSQTEQDLACNGGQGAAYEAVTDLLSNESVADIDRLRLFCGL